MGSGTGVPPAVEPGILPGGLSCGFCRHVRVQNCFSGRQEAALYGSQAGCRYTRKPTLNTYAARFYPYLDSITAGTANRARALRVNRPTQSAREFRQPFSL